MFEDGFPAERPRPALFRGDFLWFCIGFVVSVLGGIATLGIAALIYALVMSFMYNGMHGRSLIEKGYQLAGSEGENALAAQKWGVMQPATQPVAQAVQHQPV